MDLINFRKRFFKVRKQYRTRTLTVPLLWIPEAIHIERGVLYPVPAVQCALQTLCFTGITHVLYINCAHSRRSLISKTCGLLARALVHFASKYFLFWNLKKIDLPLLCTDPQFAWPCISQKALLGSSLPNLNSILHTINPTMLLKHRDTQTHDLWRNKESLTLRSPEMYCGIEHIARVWRCMLFVKRLEQRYEESLNFN